jgi:hypothetical protein
MQITMNQREARALIDAVDLTKEEPDSPLTKVTLRLMMTLEQDELTSSDLLRRMHEERI